MALFPGIFQNLLMGLEGRRVRIVILVVALCCPALRTLGQDEAEPRRPDYIFSDSEAFFVDELERRALLYFQEQTDDVSGLTYDRASTKGGQSHAPASIAATGFALTAWCIADHRHWLVSNEARRRVTKTLKFILTNVPNERGWIYHFVDARTGARMWECEASTIDTALLLHGAIAAREYLQDPEVTRLVNQLYARIDWNWALDGGTTLSHGWRPENGFVPHRWDSFAEMLGMYLLGIGAPGPNPLPPATWRAWKRGPVVTYAGRTFIQCPPLFTHQYTQAWFDFRGLLDNGISYWQNSVDATLAQKEWCASKTKNYPMWAREVWGVTASDGPRGYSAHGTPFGPADEFDGTLAPCAAGGSLPFAPRECLRALLKIWVGGKKVWGRYGFADAFNPKVDWVSTDVVGIDVGITFLMTENLRSGLVWQYFMQAPEVKRGLILAGFSPTQAPAVPATPAR
jgi:hypothetical protein